MTAGVVILMYVTDELSFDNFHTQGDKIYRIETALHQKDGSDAGKMDSNGWPVGHLLKKDFPEVEAVSYSQNGSALMVNHEGKKIKQNIHFASQELLDMFSFQMVKGNKSRALTEPYQVVITESMEKKFFNEQDALNKTIILSDTLSFVVSGVVQDLPSNSHIQFDMLLSFPTYEIINSEFDYAEGWGNLNMRNYILVKEGTDIAALKSKAENMYMTRAGAMMKEWGMSATLLFTPLADVYLRTNRNGFGPVGSIDRVYMVSIIAAFVILLACINFVNLTTARSVFRAKEVGIRKVAGSSRFLLIRQFLSESFILTIAALLTALALTGLLMPFFNNLLGKTYSINNLFTPEVGVGITVLTIVITVLSGYYPALVMSRMTPGKVLKGRMHTSTQGVQLRRMLVVFQFVISVGLVVGTLIILNQLKYMQERDLGFAKDEIFVVNASQVQSSNSEAYRTFKEELKSLTSVEEVSFANALPGRSGWDGQIAYPEGKTGDEAVSVEYMAVDEDYLQTLGLKLIAGESFSPDNQASLSNGLLLNEVAVQQFGWTSPDEAIGKMITSPSGYPSGKVIGVVKNYHNQGLQQQIGAQVMDFEPGFSYLYAVKFKTSETSNLVESINSLWKKNFPGLEFQYFFLNDDFARQYKSEEKLASTFMFFAVLATVIGCIGLLGLISFLIITKTKEIGVRKVLGATVADVTMLLSREFIILILVAQLIAFPLAWYFASSWLTQFAFRTPLNLWVFAGTSAIAFALAMATIGIQTVRASSANPVDSLRYE